MRSIIPVCALMARLSLRYRSLSASGNLVGFLGELNGKGIDLYLHQHDDAGRQSQVPDDGRVCRFERAMIVERSNPASRVPDLRASGWVGPTISSRKKAPVQRLLAGGTGIVKAAKTVGVGVIVVPRIKSELAT